jgi:hypothetical protein
MKVYDRYDEASTALGTKVHEGDVESDEYASELHRAQRMADKALEDFRAAEVDQKAALKALEPYKGTVPSKEDHAERTKQEKKRDDATELMAKARSRIESAKDVRDEAAKRAAKRIKSVIYHDEVHDPGSGGFMDWIADHADWFSAAATVLAVVALGAAIVFTGGLAAPLIAGLAAAASATALSGRLYDVFSRGGKFDALKIGFDVLGLFPGFGVIRGLKAEAQGARLLAAQHGLWEAFTNGFGVKRVNDVTKLAYKFLAKRGITKVKLPEGGFDPEVVTRYIKGAGLTHLVVDKLSELPHRTFDTVTPPPGDARPTPAPDTSPSAPSRSGTPSPTPQPSPTSASFRAALAPTG